MSTKLPGGGGMILRHCVLVGLLLACKQPPSRDAAFDDPAQASVRVRALVVNCAGVTRALDEIARSRCRGAISPVSSMKRSRPQRVATCATPSEATRAAHQLARCADRRRTPRGRARRVDVEDRACGPLSARRALRSHGAQRRRARRAHRDAARRVRRHTRAHAARVDRSARGQARGGRACDRDCTARRATTPRISRRQRMRRSMRSRRSRASGRSSSSVAAADRLEELQGPAAVLDARERAVTLDASVAENWDALGRARIAAGKIDDALAAWDHAIDIAPAQPAFRIAPIRALVIAEQPQRARARADALAKQARAGSDVELSSPHRRAQPPREMPRSRSSSRATHVHDVPATAGSRFSSRNVSPRPAR